MRAMILAAGRGQRMGELTEKVPKALLKVGGRYLIEYPLQALVRIGVKEVVINTCYLGQKIKLALGNGQRYGLNILYSDEAHALETGGGIYKALPLLGQAPFIVLSCDVVTDYDLQNLPTNPQGLAHLVLVDNPSFHPQGDFCLKNQTLYLGDKMTLTFGNIGVYRPELFAHSKPGKFPLGGLLQDAVGRNQVTGEHFQGLWYNFGSPSQLHAVTELPAFSL